MAASPAERAARCKKPLQNIPQGGGEWDEQFQDSHYIMLHRTMERNTCWRLPMHHPSRPAVGVSAIILDGAQVLLGWRVAGHGAGSWQLPGGHLEFGECIEECARREVLEETGLSITNLRLGPYTNDLFSAEGRHYVTLYVLADFAGGIPAALEPTKCSHWQWFPWSALPEPLFLPLANLLRLGFSPPPTERP
jgi:8-oxo-dGTP diphosphatase